MGIRLITISAPIDWESSIYTLQSIPLITLLFYYGCSYMNPAFQQSFILAIASFSISVYAACTCLGEIIFIPPVYWNSQP